MSGGRRRRLLGLLGLLGVLAIWEAAARLGLVNTTLTSSPTALLKAGIDQVNRGTLWEPLATSSAEFLLGIALAVVVGIPVGLLAGRYRRFGEAVDPWLTILNSTPSVALVPLFIFLFGIDIWIKAMVIFFFTVFPITINTLVGVRATANRYLRVANSFQASEWMLMRSVIVPGTVPYILVGLRVGGGHGLVGLIVAEFVAGSAGIGYVISLAGNTYNTALLMFFLAILGCAGVAYNAILHRLEERVEQWRPRFQRT